MDLAPETKTVQFYEGAICADNPHLGARESRTITRLAMLYVMLDAHAERLAEDPTRVLNGDAYQKLAALALRHEDALGISVKRAPKDDPDKPDTPADIRRR